MMDSPRTAVSDLPDCWPALPLASWKDTCTTLNRWAQMVGKVRLALTPLSNHWWNVALYVSTCGLTTSPIPYGPRLFEMEFDFIEHQLHVRTSDRGSKDLPLTPRSVADFYRDFRAVLKALEIDVEIWTMPVEIADPIPFDQDRVHASYDPASARKFWRILVSADEVFKVFRSRFIGKSSPVHFFWGGFDLAVTRFSGRRAPERNDADPILRKIMREGYSHEVISAGFWPGGGGVEDAAFYSRCGRQARFITPGWANTSSRMKTSAARALPRRHCSNSCRARMKLVRSPGSGTGKRWRGHPRRLREPREKAS